MLYKEQFSTIRRFVQLVTQLSDVIETFDNRPADKMPLGEYCSISMSDAVPYGRPINERAEIDDISFHRKIKQQKTMEITLNFYRDNAFELASKMQGSDELDNVNLLLQQNAIGIKKIHTAKRLPKLQSAKYEERAMIKIEIYFEDVAIETVPKLNNVGIEVWHEKGYKIYPEDSE